MREMVDPSRQNETVKFEKSFIKDIAIIKEASSAGKLVLFVGAGVSKNSKVPTWAELISELTNDLDINTEENPLKIAQIYFNERGPKECLDKVGDILKVETSKLNPIHRILLELKPTLILTTNYDNLLEAAATEYHYPFSVISNDRALPRSKYGSFIVKVHGDLTGGGENIVLKEDDYLEYHKNYPLIKSFLESVFASKVVLFVGYGYRDDNLKQIINQAKNLLGKDFQNAYLINPTDKKISDVEVNYFKRKGINTILFNDKINNFLEFERKYNQDSSQETKR